MFFPRSARFLRIDKEKNWKKMYNQKRANIETITKASKHFVLSRSRYTAEKKYYNLLFFRLVQTNWIAFSKYSGIDVDSKILASFSGNLQTWKNKDWE